MTAMINNLQQWILRRNFALLSLFRSFVFVLKSSHLLIPKGAFCWLYKWARILCTKLSRSIFWFWLLAKRGFLKNWLRHLLIIHSLLLSMKLMKQCREGGEQNEICQITCCNINAETVVIIITPVIIASDVIQNKNSAAEPRFFRTLKLVITERKVNFTHFTRFSAHT